MYSNLREWGILFCCPKLSLCLICGCFTSFGVIYMQHHGVEFPHLPGYAKDTGRQQQLHIWYVNIATMQYVYMYL